MRQFQRDDVTWDEMKANLNGHSSKDYGDVKRWWQETWDGVR
jgi:hypothetical protein